VIAPAIGAGVPADTNAGLPSFTSFKPTTIDESFFCRRLRRCSSISMISVALTTEMPSASPRASMARTRSVQSARQRDVPARSRRLPALHDLGQGRCRPHGVERDLQFGCR
jgi:hypothetical protein